MIVIGADSGVVHDPIEHGVGKRRVGMLMMSYQRSTPGRRITWALMRSIAVAIAALASASEKNVCRRSRATPSFARWRARSPLAGKPQHLSQLAHGQLPPGRHPVLLVAVEDGMPRLLTRGEGPR
jgi:hypothetical protein